MLISIAHLPKLELVELYDEFQQDENNGTENDHKLMKYMLKNSDRLSSLLGEKYSPSLENKVTDFLSAVSGLAMKLEVKVLSEDPNKPTMMQLICPHYEDKEYDTYLTKFQQTRRKITLTAQTK